MEQLRAEGRDVVLTHEPGGTDVTLAIRRLLADPESKLDPRAELLLFLADRAQHVATVIQPALARGAIVVCDRYSDSTMAYQGYGRGHKMELLLELNAWAADGLEPDLTVWIDVDIETGLRRARGGGGPGDRFEAEPLAFHTAIHQGFAELAAKAPSRFVRINGDQELDAVRQDVWEATRSRLQ